MPGETSSLDPLFHQDSDSLEYDNSVLPRGEQCQAMLVRTLHGAAGQAEQLLLKDDFYSTFLRADF